ncbi:MAG: hypothetical protein EBS53_03740 [Bacteroidetes bacterium]|nr:hypothetical protein [Bacteroidota bacterium]
MEEKYKFESEFWGDCCNTFGEDQKHYIYGNLMGLTGSYFSYDAAGKRILDIGGGPSSILLKTVNLKEGKVCDPIKYPDWTVQRYASKNISVQVIRGEDINEKGWDEVWLYNVLQHTDDPERIVQNAKKAASILRIFEWVDIPAHTGHPQMLTQENLDKWVGQKGKIGELNGQNNCYGKCFYGCFAT